MNARRIFLKSFGCSANLADSETLVGALEQAGHELVESAGDAELIIYNTCAVKGPTENRIINALKHLPPGVKVVVAGCLPLISFERLCREVPFDGIVGPAAANRIVGVVERVFDGEKVVEFESELNMAPELNLPHRRSSPIISVVPVSYGCLGSCAYCCVVFARGHLRSCSIREIVERVKHDLVDGVCEFWITAQDTGCYGKDIGTSIADLLKELTVINENFKVRVGMMTPSMIRDSVKELIEAFRSEKVFKFLHLPVQSGDNQILKRMRRFYTVQEFSQIVSSFREAFPDATLATDIISGFPGETRESFEKTLELLNEVKPDIVNVSKFFPRPKTAALRMRRDFVTPSEIKRRSTQAAFLARRISLEKNQRWIDWTGEVLIDEKGKTPNSWIGRNFAYKPIVLKSTDDLLGKNLTLRILKASTTNLVGVNI
jgi:threonylcarbamoyladenosine tRNA methylthiotransferase CDKAL1